jgi:hypothetical protein
VVVGGPGGTVRVWDATTGRPLSPAWVHGTRARGAAFSPDGRLVATGGSDGTARVWEAATGQPVTPYLRQGGEVFGAAFSPDGHTLLTWCQDRTARLWGLVPDDRPVTDLVLLAQLLSGHRLDAFGSPERLSPAEQCEALARLRARYPAELGVTPEQVMAWHRLEAARCSRMGDANAALFHLLHSSPVWPLLPGLPP